MSKEHNEITFEKKSHCYGCEQELQSYSMLICHECLNYECERFESLASGGTKPTRRKRRK